MAQHRLKLVAIKALLTVPVELLGAIHALQAINDR